MEYYDDSYVKVYHGPRRGGKTSSATGGDGVPKLLNHGKVYSNYPIDFWFKDGPDSELKHYYSEPLICEELLKIDDPKIQKKYSRSLCIWDETAVSLFARNPQAVVNKMFSLVITLIGKLELSLDCTVQFLSLLDKNVRIQMDALIYCHDLSFKYRQLNRGTTISQIWQDISGRYTGDMYEYSNQTFQQTFYAKWTWPIYDTKKTFDILEAQRKISWDELREDRSGYQYSNREANINLLYHVINELYANMVLEERETLKMAAGSFWNFASGRGFTESSKVGNELMEGVVGIIRKGGTNPYYEFVLPEEYKVTVNNK